MYGLIAKLTSKPGQREAVVAAMLESSGAMPGCLGYVVATDTVHDDVIWVTEVWESKGAHEASLSLPEVRRSIEKAMPLIADFSQEAITEPVGGVSLPGAR